VNGFSVTGLGIFNQPVNDNQKLRLMALFLSEYGSCDTNVHDEYLSMRLAFESVDNNDFQSKPLGKLFPN